MTQMHVSMDVMATRIANISRPQKQLVDETELGKPHILDSVQLNWSKWSRLKENLLTDVLDEAFRVVTEFAGETESELKKNDIVEMFGQSAYELDRVEDVRYKKGQWYIALMALTEEAAQDIVKGAEAGNGVVATR